MSEVDEIRKTLIMAALRYNLWNKRKAAESLGITLKELYKCMHEFGINIEEEET